MPRLAIIIPWCDSQAAFEDTLVSVLQHRPKRTEILVVHSHPYADPYGITDEDVLLVERPGSSELQLINAGLRLVNSPIVHVLRCGLQVESGWAEPALSCFNDPSISSVVPVVLDRAQPDRIALAGVAFSRGGERCVCGEGRAVTRVESLTRQVVGPALGAGFYRTDDILALDGFDELVEAYADVDAGLSLKALGQQCLVCPESRLVGAAEVRQRGFVAARQLERVFWRHVARPAGKWRLFLHGCSIAARLFAQLPSPSAFAEACGRLAGMLERDHYEQFRQRLEEIRPPDIHALPDSGNSKRQRMAA